MYSWIPFVFLIFVTAVQGSGMRENLSSCPNVKKPLHSVRKRRHLSFPDGSSASITIDLAKAFQTHVPSGWMATMDIDVIFPLPDSKFTAAHSRRKLHHRQKRDVWEKIEEALNLHNFNGRACVLRSICEAKHHLFSPGKSLVHDILRAILSIHSLENAFEEEVGSKYHEVLHPDVCEMVHECPVSLLHFIFYLNKPNNARYY